ncbi:hypothetical protein [Vibrio sp. 10N.261.46.A3]|uniref:hypothetical protein n=1 Tax=Vibrio sp. 10N.261.46.A3 TaxID=3229658 RepID=UPI00354D3D1C
MKNNLLQRKASGNETDLNITPFLSLMVVLIPVLLVSARFSLFAQYEVYAQPNSSVSSSSQLRSIAPYLLRVTDTEFILLQDGKVLFRHEVADRASLISTLTGRLNSLSESAPLSISLEASYSHQDIVGLFDLLAPYAEVFSSVSMDVKDM